MKTIVKGGLVITFIHEGYHSIKMKYADLLIEDGRFLDIKEEITDASARVVDAHGLWVLPGLVDVASSAAGAVLLNGLLPDYSRARWQGSMIHGRALPVLEIASDLLSEEEKRAVMRYALLLMLDGGATTLADLTPPAFAGALRHEAESLGIRALIYPERTAQGTPAAEHSGLLRVPPRKGGEFAPGDALFSVETTSPEMYAQARRAQGPLLVRAAYCEYERQVSRMAFGASPLEKLDKEGLLTGRTIVAGGYQTDFFDRERLRTAGASVAMSAVTAMQDGVPFPIVTLLKQDVNTCLSTGYFGLSMLDEMRQAAFGGKLESSATQFQASDAFYAATIAGAQALGEQIGRIEPGYNADLLFVDPAALGPHNYPLIQLVYRGGSRDIVSRMVGGRMLPLEQASLASSAAAAQRAAQRVWAEARKTIL